MVTLLPFPTVFEWHFLALCFFLYMTFFHLLWHVAKKKKSEFCLKVCWLLVFGLLAARFYIHGFFVGPLLFGNNHTI